MYVWVCVSESERESERERARERGGERERQRERERERGRERERDKPVADAEDAEGVLSSASVYLPASRYLDSHTSLYVCMYVTIYT